MEEYNGAQVIFDPDNPDQVILKEAVKEEAAPAETSSKIPDDKELFKDVEAELGDAVADILKNIEKEEQKSEMEQNEDDELPIEMSRIDDERFRYYGASYEEETAEIENPKPEMPETPELETPKLETPEPETPNLWPKEPLEEPQEAEENPKLDAILNEMELMKKSMFRLEQSFEKDILNSEARDSSVKSMYMELQEYKKGIVERALKNVLYDIVDFRETMVKQLRGIENDPENRTVTVEDLSFYIEALGDVLEKHDVSIYRAKPGDDNVPIRQKIVKKVETDSPEQVRKVAESLSYGYEYNDKVLYPERINIYTLKNKELLKGE